jgi:hypothetical protein
VTIPLSTSNKSTYIVVHVLALALEIELRERSEKNIRLSCGTENFSVIFKLEHSFQGLSPEPNNHQLSVLHKITSSVGIMGFPDPIVARPTDPGRF